MNDSADGLLDQWLNRRGTPAADRVAQDATDDEPIAGEPLADDLVDAEVVDVVEIVEVVEVDAEVAELVEAELLDAEDEVEVEDDVSDEVADEVGETVEVVVIDEATENAAMLDTPLDPAEQEELTSLSDIGDELARIASEQAAPRHLPSDDAARAVLAAFAALDSDSLAPLEPREVIPDSATTTVDPAAEMVDEGSPVAPGEEPVEAVTEPVVEPVAESDIHVESDPVEEMVEEGSPIDPAHPLASEEPEPQPEPEQEEESEELPEPERLDPPDPAVDPTASIAPTAPGSAPASVDDIVASLDIPGLAPLSASTSALLASLTAPAAPAPAPSAASAPVAVPQPAAAPVAEPPRQPHHRKSRGGFFRRHEEPTAADADPDPAPANDAEVDIAIAANGPAYDDHRSPAEIAAALSAEADPEPEAEPDDQVVMQVEEQVDEEQAPEDLALELDAMEAQPASETEQAETEQAEIEQAEMEQPVDETTDEPAPEPAEEPAVHGVAMPAAGQPYEYTFASPARHRGLPTLLLAAGVVATAAACWWAFATRDVAAIAIAGVVAVITAIIWAARAGDAAARLYMRGSRLMIERAGTRTQFDLADPHTPLTITGSPETGDWRATFTRRGMSSVVLDSSAVDPADFMRVVETYRPTAEES